MRCLLICYFLFTPACLTLCHGLLMVAGIPQMHGSLASYGTLLEAHNIHTTNVFSLIIFLLFLEANSNYCRLEKNSNSTFTPPPQENVFQA